MHISDDVCTRDSEINPVERNVYFENLQMGVTPYSKWPESSRLRISVLGKSVVGWRERERE